MWKQKGKVLQLVTGARPPCPTLVGSGYQQVGDRNSLPRTSLVAFHRSTSGCDALFISISLEFAFKIFFFFFLGLSQVIYFLVEIWKPAISYFMQDGLLAEMGQLGNWQRPAVLSPWAPPATPVSDWYSSINTEAVAYSKLVYQEQENRILRRV